MHFKILVVFVFVLHTLAHGYIYIYINMYICYIYIIYILYILYIYTCTYTHIHTQTCIHSYTHTCMYICAEQKLNERLGMYTISIYDGMIIATIVTITAMTL